MTRLLVAAVAIGVWFSGAIADAAFDDKGWAWQRPIDLKNANGFAALPVPAEIFDESQPDLADLRVLDESNNLVQHMIIWSDGAALPRVENREVQLLNATYQPGQFSRATLDFGRPLVKNEIRVNLPGQNFRRRATIEGSNDSQSWETVAENLWLFDVSVEGRSFKADALRFPENNFRYLRLTIYNMPDDPERVTIDSVTAAHAAAETTGAETLPPRITSTEQDEKHKRTIWHLDAGSRNLPITRIALAFPDPYFHRAFELSARNSTTETVNTRTESGSMRTESETPWESIVSGVFYRIVENSGQHEHVHVHHYRMPYRYFKLTVSNQDNPPLRLDSTSASLAQAKVVFPAKPSEGYSLLYGNSTAGPPSFDIAHAVRNLDPARLPVAAIGAPRVVTPRTELAPWTERHSTLLLVLLVLCVAAMLALVFNSMRKIPQPPV